MPTPTNRRKIVPLIMMGAGILLILAAIASMAMLNPQRQQTIQTPTPSVEVVRRIPYPKIERISAEDAKAAFDMGAALFVDVRGKGWYDMEHIPGALSMPEDDLYMRLHDLDSTAWIIPYCS